jgi:cytochrome bd-type quinol oxidase subunit 1
LQGASQSYVSSIAAFAAGFWRVFITPVTSMKTSMQTNGNLDQFYQKIATGGFFAAYDGAFNAWFATTVGFYPWGYVHGIMEKKVAPATSQLGKLSRAAFINVVATFVSDVCSNSIRVVQNHQSTGADSKWALVLRLLI